MRDLPGVKDAWGEVFGFAQYIKIVRTECRSHSYERDCSETIFISNGFAPTFGGSWDTSPYAKQWELIDGKAPENNKDCLLYTSDAADE